MINYFHAAENTLRARGSLDAALINLRRRQEGILAANCPGEYQSPDFGKMYSSVGAINDALANCLDLCEVGKEIEATKAAILEIDRVIGQLGPQEREVIRLWYIERKTKDEIADMLNYASNTSLYDLRNKAVAEFAIRYFGAGAISGI